MEGIVTHVLGAPNSIYRRYDINNMSLTVIQFIDDKFRLIGLNDTSRLHPIYKGQGFSSLKQDY